MSLPDMKIDSVSEELVLQAAKALYLKEDGEGCAFAGNGGLASASDLGRLPVVALNQRRKRAKMAADENLDVKMPKMPQMPQMPQMPDMNTDTSSDDNDSPAPTPSDSSTTATDESMAIRFLRMYEDAMGHDVLASLRSGGKSGDPKVHVAPKNSDSKYMVSWADPRHLEKLHDKQTKLGNGLFYVVFDSKDKGTNFYKDLYNRGINNLKIDVL